MTRARKTASQRARELRAKHPDWSLTRKTASQRARELRAKHPDWSLQQIGGSNPSTRP